MNYEYEIQNLKNQIKDLQDSARKLAKGNTEEVSKREQTTAQVDSLTPYTDTKTAYIGDTECVFDNVPNGCVGVFINGVPDGCVARYEPTDRVVIHFDEPLEEVTEVTISIQ